MRRSLIILLSFTLLSLIATHPLWQCLSACLPGDIGDPVLNTYIIGWDVRALVNDPLNIFQAGIFYPLPNTLAYSENLIGNALLALPVALLGAQPVLAYNVAFLLSFALSGYGMYLLLLHLTQQRAAAFVAGLAFACAPYRLASLAHIQLLTVQWLPLIALCLWRMAPPSSVKVSGVKVSSFARVRHRASSIRWFVLCLLFLWLQVASSLHGALFAAFIIAVWLIVALASRFILRQAQDKPRHASRITLHTPHSTLHTPHSTLHVSRFIALLIFILLLLPFIAPYLAIADELRAARPPALALSFLAAPTDFLAAYPWNRLYGAASEAFRQRDGFTEEQTLFMGLVIPLLALLGLWQARQPRGWLVVMLLSGATLALSEWLVQALPFASLMRVPARWGLIITFALAGLCGLGMAGLLKSRMRVAARRSVFSMGVYLCAAVALFFDGFSAPIPLATLGTLQSVPAVYHFLAQQPGAGALIELPMFVAPDAEFPEGKRMVASLLHEHPLVNGYSGFTPKRQSELAAQLKNFPDAQSFTALRALAPQGVRYLIVHSGEPGIPRREWVQTRREQAKQSGVLRFVQSFNDDDLFEIVK